MGAGRTLPPLRPSRAQSVHEVREPRLQGLPSIQRDWGCCPGATTIRPVKLNDKQRRYLRGLAHPLKPLILIGNGGVSEGVIAETRRALQDHELIKVRMTGADREARDAALEGLAKSTDSALVGRIGHVATLYRRRAELAKIVLPD